LLLKAQKAVDIYTADVISMIQFEKPSIIVSYLQLLIKQQVLEQLYRVGDYGCISSILQSIEIISFLITQWITK